MPITAVFGQHEQNTLAQLEDVASRAAYTALMADGHLGYIMPIGGVAAYRNAVDVTGVGFDIACGNAAILTNLNIADIGKREELELLAHEITRSVSFGVGRTNKTDNAPVDDPLFDAPEWGALPADCNVHNLKGKARSQLGTVGSGNHYVDVFADERGSIWVGVHFGSRGFGHTVASGFLAMAQGKKFDQRVSEQASILDLSTELGDAYWALMELAGCYAYAGREWVARKVVGLLGGKEVDMVHNHHNFAWKEKHFGEDLIVVRKGATPAFPGQRGFVGGSMGDNAVILEGAQATPQWPATERNQEDALFSTVHGAGRVMSRTEARGKINRRTGEIIKPGKVTWDMVNDWLGPQGVVLRGGGLDEAPQAYRRLPDVLAAQGDTINVLHTLTPLIVVMAGANEYDPYKD